MERTHIEWRRRRKKWINCYHLLVAGWIFVAQSHDIRLLLSLWRAISQHQPKSNSDRHKPRYSSYQGLFFFSQFLLIHECMSFEHTKSSVYILDLLLLCAQCDCEHVWLNRNCEMSECYLHPRSIKRRDDASRRMQYIIKFFCAQRSVPHALNEVDCQVRLQFSFCHFLGCFAIVLWQNGSCTQHTPTACGVEVWGIRMVPVATLAYRLEMSREHAATTKVDATPKHTSAVKLTRTTWLTYIHFLILSNVNKSKCTRIVCFMLAMLADGALSTVMCCFDASLCWHIGTVWRVGVSAYHIHMYRERWRPY